MALPEKLADLFGPKNSPTDGPIRTGLQNLGYQITWDPLNDGTAPPELQSQLVGLYEASRHRPDRALAERLRQLVQQYPDVPILKNYLMTTYTLTGQQSRADDVLSQTLEQHPRYLLGLVNKANQLLKEGDTAGVEELFGGPPSDIARLYPERSVFQASEVGHFTYTAFTYYIVKEDPDAAETRLRLLRDLGYHAKDQLRKMKDRLDMARMYCNMDRMRKGLANAVTIEAHFRADDQQTTEPPVFQHPEIQWLYTFGLELPADKRDALLALPRPSLTADLSKVLLDTVYRYRYFQEQEWDEQQHSFASHALLLAAELRADECLNAVLETLRQDDDFQEFWWGDYLNDFYEPYFRQLLPAHAEALKAFMQEPDVNTSAKACVSEAYAQEVLADPSLKPTAQDWYADVLSYLIQHADDEHVLDTDLIAFVIGDITDLQLTELLPLIREAYGRDLVTKTIQGDLGDTEQEMVKPIYPTDRRMLRTLAEQYEYLRDPAAYRQAHPDPVRERLSDDFMNSLEAKEAEWAFLYDDEEDEDEDERPNGALFSAPRMPFFSGLAQPLIKQPAPGRNDKVSVRYPDGTTVRDVKYKKVEADVEAGACELL